MFFCCWWFLGVSAETRREASNVLLFVGWGIMWVISVGKTRLNLPYLLFLPLLGWVFTGFFFAVNQRVFNEIACRVCKVKPKFHSEIPYCKKCLANSLNKALILKQEVEERIEIAEKLGMQKQIEGAKDWFVRNLPEPIKWILANLIVRKSMLESRKVIEKVNFVPFDPEGLEKFPVDIAQTDLNIPSEGLKILEKIFPTKAENKI